MPTHSPIDMQTWSVLEESKFDLKVLIGKSMTIYSYASYTSDNFLAQNVYLLHLPILNGIQVNDLT